MARKTIGRRMLALGLGLGIAATALAGASAASAAATTTRIAATDDVIIKGPNFDFGAQQFSSGAPNDPGTLRWLMVSGKPKPQAQGFIHIKNANGSCAYLQLESLDASGTVLNTETSTPNVCATSNALASFPVTLGSYKNENIAKVKLKLVKVTGVGTSTVGSKTIVLTPPDDEVIILETGFMFGSSGFVNGAPPGNGIVSWTYDSDGPHAFLDGVIHLDQVAGACARMQLEYLDAAGASLGTENGGKVCAVDNGHQGWTVDLGNSAVDNLNTVSVNVNLQTLGVDGVWRTAGSDEAFFSTPYFVPIFP